MVSEFDSRSTVMLDNLSDKGERRSKNGGRVGMGECNVTFDFIFSKNRWWLRCDIRSVYQGRWDARTAAECEWSKHRDIR